MATNALEFRRAVKATAAETYRAFTRPMALREWLCDGATADARIGGHWHYWWNNGYYASGAFTALDQDARVAFTWLGKGEPAETQVEVILAPTEAGTVVRLTHAGVGLRGKWSGPRKEFMSGWDKALENLQSVLETGQDLRFVRRPMLGVLVDEFNAEFARRLNVPVVEGIRIAGVVEGMGAQLAGLQKDDVMVALGGLSATNWPELTNALQDRRAGDVVKVTFYRGAEKQVVDMALSQRPIPEAPPSPQALAEAVQALNTQVAEALSACLQDITEAEANYRPAPHEWNALEVVAHLVATERENQTWITDLINDDERWGDRFENPTNVAARIGAIVAMYPTVEMMLELLSRSQGETVGMLAMLPPTFVAHKGSYWRLARDLQTQLTEHLREHVEQIRKVIAAARQ